MNDFKLERDIAVVVERLQACPLPVGSRSRSVGKAVAGSLGRKKFNVLRHDIDARTLNALTVLVVSQFYRTAYGNFVALLRIARNGFAETAPSHYVEKVGFSLTVRRAVISVYSYSSSVPYCFTVITLLKTSEERPATLSSSFTAELSASKVIKT